MHPTLARLLKTSWGRDAEWNPAAHPAWIAEAGERCGRPLPAPVRELLAEVNGLEAEDGVFRMLGVGPGQRPWSDLAQRNAPNGWMRFYGRLREGLVFIAHDAFGNHFAWDEDASEFVHFDVETGEKTRLGSSSFGWLERVIEKPERWIQLGAFEGYMDAGGDLGPHEMIAFKLGLALGGEPLFGNMVARCLEAGLCLAGQIAGGLSDLPDGTAIEGVIIIREPPGA